MSNKYWSRDRETFNDATLGDLLDANSELVVGDIVYYGESNRPDASMLIDAYDIIDAMGNRAYDLVGEHADNFPNVSQRGIDSLNAFLSEWAAEHCEISFFTVVNIKEYVLTSEDVDEGN